MTTEMEVEMLRTKPKVAVAVAISRFATIVCSANSGDWKLGPTPIPAIIWKMMILAHPGMNGKSIYSPKPSNWKLVPKMISGRYFPVFLTKKPVKPAMKDRDKAKGRR